jgi:hypothetical protein
VEKKLSTTALAQQLAVARRTVMTPLIGVDQELVGFNLSVPHRSIQLAERTYRCDTARYRQPAVVQI